MLSNHKEIREELHALGVDPISETDTELIVQYIGYYVNQKKMTTREAIIKVLEEKLEGTFALAIINKDEPNKIFLTKNTGTMIVGVHDDFLIACSEPEVFQNFTDKYFVVGDNELIEVDIDNISNELKKHELKKAEKQEVRTKPKAGYSHFLE